MPEIPLALSARQIPDIQNAHLTLSPETVAQLNATYKQMLSPQLTTNDRVIVQPCTTQGQIFFRRLGDRAINWEEKNTPRQYNWFTEEVDVPLFMLHRESAQQPTEPLEKIIKAPSVRLEASKPPEKSDLYAALLASLTETLPLARSIYRNPEHELAMEIVVSPTERYPEEKRFPRENLAPLYFTQLRGTLDLLETLPDTKNDFIGAVKQCIQLSMNLCLDAAMRGENIPQSILLYGREHQGWFTDWNLPAAFWKEGVIPLLSKEDDGRPNENIFAGLKTGQTGENAALSILMAVNLTEEKQIARIEIEPGSLHDHHRLANVLVSRYQTIWWRREQNDDGREFLTFPLKPKQSVWITG